MSAVDTLRMLAAGERPRSGLLHTARLEAFGIEVFGEEAVVASLHSGPMILNDDAAIVEATGHLAIFDDDNALIADLFGANISRLWRMGGGPFFDPEPGISVSFDPDLAQARGTMFLSASDHPALDGDAVDSVRRAGEALARSTESDAYRTRTFAIRAFGTAAHGAALFAVHRLTGDPIRQGGYSMAAVRWTGDMMHIVRDRAGEAAISARPWTPRIND
jgi:hypothetical protein